jgi:hypothetical protein
VKLSLVTGAQPSAPVVLVVGSAPELVSVAVEVGDGVVEVDVAEVDVVEVDVVVVELEVDVVLLLALVVADVACESPVGLPAAQAVASRRPHARGHEFGERVMSGDRTRVAGAGARVAGWRTAQLGWRLRLGPQPRFAALWAAAGIGVGGAGPTCLKEQVDAT